MMKMKKIREWVDLGVKMSTGQCSGSIRNSQGETCVVGSAWEGIEGEKMVDDTTKGMLVLEGKIPELRSWVKCPRCNNHALQSITYMMVHQNDVHRLTREEIADWADQEVAKVKAKEKPVQVSEVVAKRRVDEEVVLKKGV